MHGVPEFGYALLKELGRLRATSTLRANMASMAF